MAKTIKKIRVMLVDDHFVVRAGIAGSLAIEADMEVVCECGTGEEALPAFRKHRPDVVLMDWRLPGMNGVETVAAIRADAPQARIIIFSIFDGEDDVFKAVQAGVCGYILKSATRRELVSAIRATARGEQVFPPSIQAKLDARRARPALNEKELTVLKGIVRGMTNKEIAAELNVAEVTVKFHVGRILEKLDVLDRTQAAMAAVERGILR
jgi:DNA-binding NarL/FixJ family response regulator